MQVNIAQFVRDHNEQYLATYSMDAGQYAGPRVQGDGLQSTAFQGVASKSREIYPGDW